MTISGPSAFAKTGQRGGGNAAARKGWEGPSAGARTYFYMKSRKAAKKTLVGEEVGGQITYSLFVFFLFNQSFKF